LNLVSLTTANALLSPDLTGTHTVQELARPRPVSDGVARLTRRLTAGDEDAFREFHRLYFDRLYRLLLVITRGQEHEAQEALQETLLRVVRYARVFETDEAFWGWLKVVARNAARDGGRKHRRYFNLLQNFALRWQNHALERTFVEDNHLGAILEESLAELDPQDRRLIEGKYLDGETVKELSAQTGLTDKAVESRLGRLRRRVRELMIKKLRTHETS
jgi:RNA polymerase sigma-70 factor (ECF subfamily)